MSNSFKKKSNVNNCPVVFLLSFSAQMDRQVKCLDVFLVVALLYQTDSQLSQTPCFVFHACASPQLFSSLAVCGCFDGLPNPVTLRLFFSLSGTAAGSTMVIILVLCSVVALLFLSLCVCLCKCLFCAKGEWEACRKSTARFALKTSCRRGSFAAFAEVSA